MPSRLPLLLISVNFGICIVWFPAIKSYSTFCYISRIVMRIIHVSFTVYTSVTRYIILQIKFVFAVFNARISHRSFIIFSFCISFQYLCSAISLKQFRSDPCIPKSYSGTKYPTLSLIPKIFNNFNIWQFRINFQQAFQYFRKRMHAFR